MACFIVNGENPSSIPSIIEQCWRGVANGKPWLLSLAAISHSLEKRIAVCPSGELRDSFAARGDVADPFFIWRESFLAARRFPRTPLPSVDISQKKNVRDPC